MEFIYISTAFILMILIWMAWAIHRMRKHLERGDWE